MFIVEMRKKLLTHSSTAKREEKVKERGSCHTLATKVFGEIMHDP